MIKEQNTTNTTINARAFREIKGYIKQLKSHDLSAWQESIKPYSHGDCGACGQTLEILCDPESVPNCDKSADLGGILECKSRLIDGSTSKLSLFSCRPDVFYKEDKFLEHLFSGSSLTIRCNRQQQDCNLVFRGKYLVLEHIKFGKLVGWKLATLQARYIQKFPAVLSADAIRKVRWGKMYYKYTKLNLYLNSSNFARFIKMIENGYISINIRRYCKKCTFKISHKESEILFGDSVTIEI